MEEYVCYWCFVAGVVHGAIGVVCAVLAIKVSRMRELKTPLEGFWRIASIFVGSFVFEKTLDVQGWGLYVSTPHGFITPLFFMFWAIGWPVVLVVRAVRLRKRFRKPPLPDVRVHDPREDPTRIVR